MRKIKDAVFFVCLFVFFCFLGIPVIARVLDFILCWVQGSKMSISVFPSAGADWYEEDVAEKQCGENWEALEGWELEMLPVPICV